MKRRFISVSEIVDMQEDKLITRETFVKIDSIYTLKETEFRGMPATLIGLSSDAIWVSESIEEIMESCGSEAVS